ncbi:hypothetical protein [Kitasatospora sp. KL5]|uniref:hypothetical protein n=1 Tax=Kitasatospora sp. KL5 TaxID=3425125 RepID=UPI003D7004C1
MVRRVLRVDVVHEDGSVCEHRIASQGAFREADCTGRAGWTATCSCGWRASAASRAGAEEERSLHALAHTTAAVPVRTLTVVPTPTPAPCTADAPLAG